MELCELDHKALAGVVCLGVWRESRVDPAVHSGVSTKPTTSTTVRELLAAGQPVAIGFVLVDD